ncbi:MAG TPA: TetR/AcrR family transcriptional regulator [Acidimicrobiales bacterium]|nr:TetR/AcrR family transcriptional regulator [Acidimicrobiales bacterium]
MPSQTRDRIVETTADLFRRQGYVATGIKQIVEEARAPFGSIYHFFPGGKEELGAEVIRASGAMYMQLFVEIALASTDVVDGVSNFFTGAAEHLEETDYEDACPIATVALEVASSSETLRQATADVFGSWLTAATEYFVSADITRTRARTLAFEMLSLLEGAFIFSRAMRSPDPVLIAGKAAVASVKAALPASPGARKRRVRA